MVCCRLTSTAALSFNQLCSSAESLSCTSKLGVEAAFRQQLRQFQDPSGYGMILLLFSLLLTHGVRCCPGFHHCILAPVLLNTVPPSISHGQDRFQVSHASATHSVTIRPGHRFRTERGHGQVLYREDIANLSEPGGLVVWRWFVCVLRCCMKQHGAIASLKCCSFVR